MQILQFHISCLLLLYLLSRPCKKKQNQISMFQRKNAEPATRVTLWNKNSQSCSCLNNRYAASTKDKLATFPVSNEPSDKTKMFNSSDVAVNELLTMTPQVHFQRVLETVPRAPALRYQNMPKLLLTLSVFKWRYSFRDCTQGICLSREDQRDELEEVCFKGGNQRKRQQQNFSDIEHWEKIGEKSALWCKPLHERVW